jgi:hypothetical protein
MRNTFFFKTLILSLTAILVQGKSIAQISSPELNYSCETAFKICQSQEQYFNFLKESRSEKSCEPKNLFYRFKITGNTTIYLNLAQTSGLYSLYGPFSSDALLNCDLIYNYSANSSNGTINDGITVPLNVTAGFYILQIVPKNCVGVFTIKLDQRYLNCYETVSCTDCVSSFSPMPGKYVVSAWVKENNSPQSTTNYSKPYVRVSFTGSNTAYNLVPTGKIIDGWQKIDSLITIPTNATNISIALKVTSGEAFFDDIRFFPIDGSMMSYVYDPINLRLMAELDERNYATFYEYDEEGKLIRIKKETEKGVMTIQENRDNILKH